MSNNPKKKKKLKLKVKKEKQILKYVKNMDIVLEHLIL